MRCGHAKRLRACAGVVVAGLGLLLADGTRAAAAQSLLERSPNLAGTWTPRAATLDFQFLHRFQATDAPARKVLNSPTFLLAAGLTERLSAGARYATNSLVRTGFPNEWELFVRAAALRANAGAPVDLLVHGGWNQAAGSFDGEVTGARDVGRVRMLGMVRGFSDAYGAGDANAAVGAGAVLRLHPNLALSGDIAVLTKRAADEDAAWSAGVQLRIPHSPHTLSIHASNVNTTTLQGASRGIGETLWGFEFTVPFTPARYFRGSGATASAPADTGDIAAEVTMTDRLLFSPDTVRIRTGSAVRWTNTSVLPHTVTADPERAAKRGNVVLPAGAAPFDSGDMAPGAVFVHTFTVPGTYRYVCVPHELAGMVGVVVVTP